VIQLLQLVMLLAMLVAVARRSQLLHDPSRKQLLQARLKLKIDNTQLNDGRCLSGIIER